MDVTFTRKPHHFSLLSHNSPTKLRSLPNQFLDCSSGRNLISRSPRNLLRPRKKCNSSGLLVLSPRRRRFVFKTSAALDSQSLTVVVSVVAVSALTVVCLENMKRKDSSKEILDPLGITESHQISGMIDWLTVDQTSGPVQLPEEISADGNEVSMKEIVRVVGHASNNKLAQLQSEETIVVKEKSLTTKAAVPSDSYIVASSISERLSSSDTIESTHLPIVLPELATLPFTLATEKNEICFEEQLKIGSSSTLPTRMVKTELIAASAHANTVQEGVVEHEKFNGELAEVDVIYSHNTVGAELPTRIVKTELIAASAHTNTVQEVVKEHDKDSHKHVEVDAFNSYNGEDAEVIRTELPTSFDTNQFILSSLENYNVLKPMRTYSSSDNKVLSSADASTLEEEKLSTHDILHTAENINGKKVFRHPKEASLNGRKNIKRSRDFPGFEEARTLNGDSHSLSPHPKSKHTHDANNYSQQLSAYNRLLREGRLTESVEKLDYLERQGSLDMDKVYHAGFFRACKSQKAVKEAFRFTNLIPNPTLSTFNMLMSVCASSQDLDGAFQVVNLVQKAGLEADCKLYTTLISTCARSKKVDTMFKVFHEMVNAGVEPNVHTYSALIDGCAKSGQVGKAFGAYGIMRAKNVKPDRVVFNALITACGQAGAVARAFDVLSEMKAETQPVDPDHVTIGALMKACANSGQVDRAKEVYSMIDEYKIKGTPEVYTIAVNCCSQTGDWEFACRVYNDVRKKGVVPDEMFISALTDVAGHAGNLDAAFDILQEAKAGGIKLGVISYSSMMGACCNAKDWQKALALYKDIKTMKLKPAVSMMNALITALCDGDQLPKAVEVLLEMKRLGITPNTITYSILVVASEKKDDLEVGLMLLSELKKDGLPPNLVMCRSLVAMCYRRFEKACALGEPLLSFSSGRLLLDSKWTSLVLMIYRETIKAGVVPPMGEFAQVLGCLRLPHDMVSRNRLIENLGVITEPSKCSNLCSLIEGFGEYDTRAFSLFEEAASLGIVSSVSFKDAPIVVDAPVVVDVRNLPIYVAEVYLLTVLKGLKHRLAAGVKLPNINIYLPVEKAQIQALKSEKTINVSGRVTQAIAALLRRLRLSYLGNESNGKIRIHGIVVRKWLQPKLGSPFSGKSMDFSSSQSKLGKGIANQQRDIRSGNLFLE